MAPRSTPAPTDDVQPDDVETTDDVETDDVETGADGPDQDPSVAAHQDQDDDDDDAIDDREFQAAQVAARKPKAPSATGTDFETVETYADLYDTVEGGKRFARHKVVYAKSGLASTAGNNYRNAVADLLGIDAGWITAQTGYSERRGGWIFALRRNEELTA